jgi:hypothetical protein
MDTHKKPHVEIFGNTMDENDCGGCGHHHQSSPVLGVMFLLSGIMLFLNVIGYVPWTVWHTIWKFWPVILIFIGIQILSDLVLFLLALYIFSVIFIFSVQTVGSTVFAHTAFPWWITIAVEMIRGYVK